MPSRNSRVDPAKEGIALIDITLAADEKLEGAYTVHPAIEIDSFRVLGLDPDDADFYASFPLERRKRIVRKVSSQSVWARGS